MFNKMEKITVCLLWSEKRSDPRSTKDEQSSNWNVKWEVGSEIYPRVLSAYGACDSYVPLNRGSVLSDSNKSEIINCSPKSQILEQL